MAERILFLTGRLAEKPLNRVLESMQSADFDYKVRQIGISVAALMTPKLIERRVPDAMGADWIMVPGRVRGDLEKLAAHYRVPVRRGPEDLRDIPEFFGHGGKPADLSRHDVRIFAEITDAPTLNVPAIVEKARAYRKDGADVIDLGCLPDTPFPHLEKAVKALKADGFLVSVDSADLQELRRGGKAGADYVLSLTEKSLSLADEIPSIPVLIPSTPGDLESLCRAMEKLRAKKRKFLADPILDPIHFGFTESLMRYWELRRRYPDAEILMGIGNLTELTGADTVGITATLMGVVSELAIRNVLVVQVSPHARRAVRELDAARRIFFRAREDHTLPIGHSDSLLCLHDRKSPPTAEEIAELAAEIRDPSFRIQISADGIHIFNRDGMHKSVDPFELFPHLGLEKDGAHAFYIGVELARAQTAWQLGKAYNQDEELDWRCAADKIRKEAPTDSFTALGHTLIVKKKRADVVRGSKGRESKRRKSKPQKSKPRKSKAKR